MLSHFISPCYSPKPTYYVEQTIQSLAYLPELRILVLDGQRESPDITSDEGARLVVVVEACKRCPNLERILHTIDTASPYEQHYSQFSVTRSSSSVNCAPTAVYTHVRKYMDFAALWWDAYDIV